MVLGEGHIPEDGAGVYHLHGLILEGIAPGPIHSDLWRRRRGELIGVQIMHCLKPSFSPGTLQKPRERVSSASAVPEARQEGHKATMGLTPVTAMKRERGRPKQGSQRIPCYFPWLPVPQAEVLETLLFTCLAKRMGL